eukprot:3306938-Pyramimonas_sp.AAC.1
MKSNPMPAPTTECLDPKLARSFPRSLAAALPPESFSHPGHNCQTSLSSSEALAIAASADV